MKTFFPTAKTNEDTPVWPVKPRRLTREQIAAARAKVQKAHERARQQRLNRLVNRRRWTDPPA